MKKLSKILSLVLALVLVVSAMSGCKKEAVDDNVITLYMMKAIDNTGSYDLVMEKANEIIKEKLGYTLDLKLIDKGNYAEKINVLLSSAEPMDLFFLSDQNTYLRYIKQDIVLPLDDLLKEHGSAILEKVDEAAWDMVRYDGKVYAVKNHGTYSTANSIVFKKDLVEKYNFDYQNVNSYDDLEVFLKAVKENEPNIYPLSAAVGVETSQRYVLSPDGTVFDNDKNEFISVFDCDTIMNQWKTMADFYQKGYLPKDIISKSDLAGERKSGKYAVLPNSGYYTEDASKSSAYYGFPCVEKYTGNTLISSASGARICLSSTSIHPEKAIQVLNLIWEDPELSNTLAYGVEGVDYVVNEERTAEIGSKSVIPKTGAEQNWAIWHNWIGPLWDQWDSPWNTVESLQNMQEMNTKGITVKSLGFDFDNERVKTEHAQCSAVYEECRPVFSNGCMNDFEEYLASAKAKFENAGLSKVLEEKNRQYSEWKKEQNK